MLLIPENILNRPIDFISIAFPMEMCKGNTTLGGFGGPENGPASPGWVAAPTFLCLGKEKSPPQRWKRNRCGAKRHVMPFLLKTWGPNKKPWAVEARFSVGRGPSLAESFSHQPATGNCEAGVQNRLDLLLFPLSLPVLNPGREIQRGGTAVPPLCVVRGCGGNRRSAASGG